MSTTIYVFEQKLENNVYLCKPEFYYIKVGFKGIKIIQACFRDGLIHVMGQTIVYFFKNMIS